jgi:3-isopropylmalate dehydrogenase
MLESVGERSAAERVEQAVMKVTPQLASLAAGKMGFSTSEVGDLLVKHL